MFDNRLENEKIDRDLIHFMHNAILLMAYHLSTVFEGIADRGIPQEEMTDALSRRRALKAQCDVTGGFDSHRVCLGRMLACSGPSTLECVRCVR